MILCLIFEDLTTLIERQQSGNLPKEEESIEMRMKTRMRMRMRMRMGVRLRIESLMEIN
jgi:hypothetical protein